MPIRGNAMRGGAWIEDQYRYRLWRKFPDVILRGAERRVVFIMLNPSTADGKSNDATIRRCVAFSKALGASRLDVVNLYAFRATNPEELWAQEDPVGPKNLQAIEATVKKTEKVILAWGTHGRRNFRGQRMYLFLESLGVDTYCFGTVANGEPKHPLYLKKNTPLLRYNLPDRKPPWEQEKRWDPTDT